MTPRPSTGALISAELQRDRTRRRTSVEFVGGPRCGDREVVEHAGPLPPRRLHEQYHRIGHRTCAGGAARYEYRLSTTASPVLPDEHGHDDVDAVLAAWLA